MRKRSGRLGGKGAPGSARSAILNYLAALDSMELAPLVQLFLQPISAAFKQQQGVGMPHTTSAHRSAHAAPVSCSVIYTVGAFAVCVNVLVGSPWSECLSAVWGVAYMRLLL